MTDITHSEYTLKLGDTTIEFDYPIRKTLDVDGKVLVLLGMDGNDSPGPRNILALDYEGNQCWKVSEPEWKPLTFVGLGESDGKIKARNSNSIVYEIDPESGEVDVLHMIK
jgi:hypothetical protein